MKRHGHNFIRVNSLICTIAVCSVMSSGCALAGHEPAPWDSSPSEISIGHPFREVDDTYYAGNTSQAAFRSALQEWKVQNPDITVSEIACAQYEYGEIVFSGMQALPDIYVVAEYNFQPWLAAGHLLDVTDEILASPYSAQYDHELFDPVTYNDRIYGFPVLTRDQGVLVYRSSVLQQLGMDFAPSTWEELQSLLPQLRELGYSEAVTLGNSTGSPVVLYLLGTIQNRVAGGEWIKGLNWNNGENSFLDDSFVESLQQTADILNSGIFNEDYNDLTAADAEKRFVNGETPAILGDVRTVERIIAESGDGDDSLIFSWLPAFMEEGNNVRTDNFSTSGNLSEASDMADCLINPTAVSSGITWFLAINPDAAEDSDRLAACVSLCEYLTGPAFTELVWQNAPLNGLTPSSAAQTREAAQAAGDGSENGLSVWKNLDQCLNQNATYSPWWGSYFGEQFQLSMYRIMKDYSAKDARIKKDAEDIEDQSDAVTDSRQNTLSQTGAEPAGSDHINPASHLSQSLTLARNAACRFQDGYENMFMDMMARSGIAVLK